MKQLLPHADITITSSLPTAFVFTSKMTIKTLREAEFDFEKSVSLKRVKDGSYTAKLASALRLQCEGSNLKQTEINTFVNYVIEEWKSVSKELYQLLFDSRPSLIQKINLNDIKTQPDNRRFVPQQYPVPYKVPTRLNEKERKNAEMYLSLLQNYHNALEDLYLPFPHEFSVFFSILTYACLSHSLFLQHLNVGLLEVTPEVANFVIESEAPLAMVIRVLAFLPRDVYSFVFFSLS